MASSFESFQGFITSLESRSPHIMQSGLGLWESPVALNPYFKYNSWYCLLKAFLFLEVVGSSSVFSWGLFPFEKKLSTDVCFLHILLACGLNLWHSSDRDVTERIRSFFKIKDFSKSKIVQTLIINTTEIINYFLGGPVPIDPRTRTGPQPGGRPV